jgi:hypothetical protein
MNCIQFRLWIVVFIITTTQTLPELYPATLPERAVNRQQQTTNKKRKKSASLLCSCHLTTAHNVLPIKKMKT